MRKPPSVVLLTFGGRHDRMALLKQYADHAMRRGIVNEWHIWNFARTEKDTAWLSASFPAIRMTGSDLVYRPAHVQVPATAAHVLRFNVRGGHNAHIALVSEGDGPSYELVLGGWGNSAVALRVWAAGTRPDHSKTVMPPNLVCPAPAVLSARAWRKVEVRLNREAATLSIVVLVQGREVLRFNADEPSPSPFNVAVMSGFGSEAEWLFADAQEPGIGLFYPTFDNRFHPWNPVYHHYAARADDYTGTVFLKCDDDIVYLDVERLADFIRFRRQRPDYFLVSANVVNNGVCAHVQQQLGMLPEHFDTLEMPPGGFRGSLWESGIKAEALHRCFLTDPARFQHDGLFVPETRFSINFVSWLGEDLPHFDTRFTDDELDLTVTVPRFLGRANAIYMPFVVSHLSFRPQDREMDVAAILNGYRSLALPFNGAQVG